MRTMIDGRWPVIALALLLASCSGEKRSDTVAAAPAGPAPAATPVAPLAPARPLGSDAVDAALTAAKDFNAKALADLAGVETAETRIRDQATRALDAARRADGARVTAARTAAEAAHKSLTDGLAAFQTAATQQQVALDMAAAMCGLPVATPAPVPGAPPAPAGKAVAPKAAPAPVVPGRSGGPRRLRGLPGAGGGTGPAGAERGGGDRPLPGRGGRLPPGAGEAGRSGGHHGAGPVGPLESRPRGLHQFRSHSRPFSPSDTE